MLTETRSEGKSSDVKSNRTIEQRSRRHYSFIILFIILYLTFPKSTESQCLFFKLWVKIKPATHRTLVDANVKHRQHRRESEGARKSKIQTNDHN